MFFQSLPTAQWKLCALLEITVGYKSPATARASKESLTGSNTWRTGGFFLKKNLRALPLKEDLSIDTTFSEICRLLEGIFNVLWFYYLFILTVKSYRDEATHHSRPLATYPSRQPVARASRLAAIQPR